MNEQRSDSPANVPGNIFSMFGDTDSDVKDNNTGFRFNFGGNNTSEQNDFSDRGESFFPMFGSRDTDPDHNDSGFQFSFGSGNDTPNKAANSNEPMFSFF